jgi:nucleotide-binding universal stress UspA family protein
MHGIRMILHPTDFSESARYAFELACMLARAPGARVIALHVAVPPVVMYDESGERLPVVEDYRQAAREELSQLQASDPRVRIERRLDEGEVAAAILRAVEEVRPDLVVMGTHGRTGLDRLVIGSVAADVMRKSPCAVAAVQVPNPKPATVGADRRLDADIVGAGRE